MEFNPDNADHVKMAFDYSRNRVGGFYGSSLYSTNWERYGRRIKAYYCRQFDNQPKWRSKLFLPTFHLGCIATLSQFKTAYASDPFVHVKAKDDSIYNPEATQKAQIAHFDLNHEISITGYKNTVLDMAWYLTLFGTAVGREYIKIQNVPKVEKEPNVDEFGLVRGIQESMEYERQELTCTDIIHPMNFAHDPTKRSFVKSSWGSVRFLMHIRDIFNMLGHPKYYQPGVKEVIEKLNKGGDPGWSHGKTTFYSETGQDYTDKKGTVVVEEYVGDLNMKGNEKDNNLYYMLWLPDFNAVLRVGRHWGRRIPYWKQEAWYDVDGPYAVDPCGMLLPFNLWENSAVNQYNDFTNAAMKYLYKVYPDNVVGGLSTLVNALPGGMVPVINEQGWGATIEPLQTNFGQVQHMGNILQTIEKYKERTGPSSNLRGKGNNQLNDTATGISLMAQREDDMIAALMDGVDQGVVDSMNLKLQHKADWFEEPGYTKLENQLVSYYPYQIYDDYQLEVVRQKSDNAAGKELSFLKLIASMNNFGSPDTTNMINACRDIGVSLGVSDIESKLPKMTPPNIQTQGGMSAPGQPAQTQPQQPQPDMSNVQSALAMA